MSQQRFLHQLSEEIKKDFPSSMDDLVVVLPNKRAKVFLLEQLKQFYDRSVFAPSIISVEELVQDIAQLRGIDAIELLFEFYHVYKDLVGDKAEDFDYFVNWARMLLQDFNEVDRYLLNPQHVFSYLKDIEDINHWAVNVDQHTDLIKNYLHFWEQIPIYYNALYAYLKEKKIGYQGMIYREAVAQHQAFLKINPKQYYFAGFNALNAAEEVIIQHFLVEKRARVFWDIDEVFLLDPYHDAGLFLRRIKQNWPYYQQHPFEWISTRFSEEKKIEIIQTPKSVGQAKIVGAVIDQALAEGQALDQIAVVLGDENLLQPVLYGLPDSVSSLNITMGYSGNSSPVQLFLNKIFKMHLAAVRRGGKQYVFYYRDVLEVLTSPVMEGLFEVDEVVTEIQKKNLTFFSFDRFDSWVKSSDTEAKKLVFTAWKDEEPAEILKRLIALVIRVKNKLAVDSQQNRLMKTFLFTTYNLLNRLLSYCEKYPFIHSIELLHVLYKQIMDMSEVSFEGDPLEGLQIMGILESRVLDFETVILTSVNEGKFPSGKSQNSFIPYDVKRELGLPTYKEKDAIYSFHFYHLLLRAKQVYLIYNSQAEGIDAGEKSRFLAQLEMETQPKHQLRNVTYSAYLPDKAYEPIAIEKSEELISKLKTIATVKGFSPSALTAYLRNPLQFYVQQVLRIREVEEVEESVALNTLGTIIHNALENLYQPYVGKVLDVAMIKAIQKEADQEVQTQFEEIYNSDKEKMGKNLLAFEVAKRNVYHFLREELKGLEQGDQVELLALETRLEHELIDSRLPYPIKLFGFVDRIECRNGKIRVIDYKTGKVESNQVKLSHWDGLTTQLKNDKIIQLLCYALMYAEQHDIETLEAGIYSFKNRREGFLFFGVREGRTVDHDITPAVLQAFREELVQLILVILDPEIAFVETI
ncbi:PD-(D/E)XK nuclease family protein [Myroides sp. WP-1]|uniref:PD-(D/E)XK nuclease family protein n=1 Tax=Myroides sp. WP-1 TaxID=2759944 RepID=UPI0015F8A4FE|nr:PD-(D/E)XK nuclease family protein [Myroides sp. WP-1]MBB1139805.1 PD-(D/E)XK nuclease family protein [Myroides sp. WP-1]